MWTTYTETSIINLQEDPDSLYNWAYKSFPLMLDELTQMVASNELNKLQHKSVVALITQDVHARDILYGMYENNVTQISDFTWQKELRYYHENEDVTVK